MTSAVVGDTLVNILALGSVAAPAVAAAALEGTLEIAKRNTVRYGYGGKKLPQESVYTKGKVDPNVRALIVINRAQTRYGCCESLRSWVVCRWPLSCLTKDFSILCILSMFRQKILIANLIFGFSTPKYIWKRQNQNYPKYY